MAKAVKIIAGAALVFFSPVFGAFAFLAQVAGIALLSQGYAELFAPKVSDAARGISPPSALVRGSREFRKAVYGQAQVSGPIVFNQLSPTDGVNENLWFVVALTDHEVDSFVSFWLDNDEIPVSAISWTPGVAGADGSGTGEIVPPSPDPDGLSKWIGENGTSGLNIFYYEGHVDQVASGPLTTAFPTEWSSAHRGRGVAYFVVQIIYNADTEKVWEAGFPRNMSAIVKGKPLYDPRLDTTQSGLSPVGSGSHRYTDSTTWEWADTPPLAVSDYEMQYMGVAPATSINWQSTLDSAEDCETLVDIPPVASPQTQEKRFTCNGVVSMGATHRENLNKINSSMDGRLSYFNGMWTSRASVWEASTLSLDTDDLADADAEVQGGMSEKERFNIVRGWYVDPLRNYQQVEFQHITASEFIDRDGGKELPNDIGLPMTNSEYMAQRIAYRFLESGDNQVLANLNLNAIGAEAAPGMVLDYTSSKHAWTNKTFRVIEWKRKPNNSYDVTLREDQASSYTDPLVSEYVVTTASGGIIPPSSVVPPPSNFTATDGILKITLDWTNPPARLFEYIDIYQSPDDQWVNAVLVATVTGNKHTLTYTAGEAGTYYFWLIARSYDGLESIREPDSDTSTIFALATYAIEEEVVAGPNYLYSDTITETDPTTGMLQFDSLTIGSIAALYIHDVDNDSNSSDWMLNHISDGDLLSFRNEADGTKYLTAAVNGTPTDNTGWWSIPLTIKNVGVIFADGDELRVSVEWLSQSQGKLDSDVRTFGAVLDGVTDDTAALAAAIAAGGDVYVPAGTLLTDPFTMANTFQSLYGDGNLSQIMRRTNGDLLTITANFVQVRNLMLTSDGTLTGDNIVNQSATNNKFINVISQQAVGACFQATGDYSGLQIHDCRFNLASGAPASASPTILGDITSSVTSLYVSIMGLTHNENDAPLEVHRCNSGWVTNCQVGGLELLDGASSNSCSNIKVQGNRITGAVTIGGSTNEFVNNSVGSWPVEFVSGSNSCVWNHNKVAVGGSITNNGNANNHIIREVSSGSVSQIQYGDDASTAIMEIDMTAGKFTFGDGDLVGEAIQANEYLKIAERAAAAAIPAGFGEFWVKNTAPTEAWFNDDTGAGFRIGNTRSDDTTTITKQWTFDAATGGDYAEFKNIEGSPHVRIQSSNGSTNYIDCYITTGNILEWRPTGTASLGFGFDYGLNKWFSDVTVRIGSVGGSSNSIAIIESAAAPSDTAGEGQVWVKNDTPNTLWFTDDAGTDTQLGVGGGDAWGDVVDAVITPDADGTRDLATTGTRFATGYFDDIDVTTNIVVGGTVDGRDVAADGTKLDTLVAALPYVVRDTAATGTQTISTTAITVNLDSEVISDANYSLSADVVTVTLAGTYEVAWQVTAEFDPNQTTARDSWSSWIEKNSATTGVEHMEAFNYWRESSGKISVGRVCMVALSASDTLRLRAALEAGVDSWNLIQYKSWMSIKRVA